MFVSFLGRLARPFKTKETPVNNAPTVTDGLTLLEFHTFFTQSGALSPKLVRPITGVANCRLALDQGRVREGGGHPSRTAKGYGELALFFALEKLRKLRN